MGVAGHSFTSALLAFALVAAFDSASAAAPSARSSSIFFRLAAAARAARRTLMARRHSAAGTRTAASTTSWSTAHGKHQHTAAHSAAVPAATSPHLGCSRSHYRRISTAGDRLKFAGGGSSQEPTKTSQSLFQEISGLVAATVADDPALQFPRSGQDGCGQPGLGQCIQGARQIAPKSVSSFPVNGIDLDSEVLGLTDDGGGPCSNIRTALQGNQVACGVVEDSVNGDSDLDNVSEVVRRITEVVRSEVQGSLMEQRLDALGVTYTPGLVNMVLKRCFKVRHLGFRFFNWVKNVPGFRHTTATYNTMLYIVGEARSVELMKALLDEMDVDMCPKDIKTWTILIASYGKTRQVGNMLSIFEAMRKSGCMVDSTVYRTILRFLCNAGKPELALEFFKDTSSRNIEVGSDIYRLLLCCLARSDNAEAVCYVRDDMIKTMRYLEEDAYLETLRSFCISGKLEEAQKVFEQMKKKSIANQDAFEIILRGFCKGGRMDEALQLIEYMRSRLSISSTALGFLIDGYVRKGDLVKALELLRGMREYGCVPLASSYTQLMQHLFASDQYKAACALYEEMEENGVEPDAVTFTALICGHVRSGHVSEAWNIFRRINEKGQRPTLKAYTVFIQELCKASKPLEALELLKEMLDSDIRPSQGTFRHIISALWGNRYLQEASSVEKMRTLFILKSHRCELQPKTLEKVNIVESKTLSDSDPEEKDMALQSFGHASNEDCKLSSCLLSEGIDHVEQAIKFSDDDVEEVCRILSSSNDWSSMQQALERRSLHFTPDLVNAILKHCKRNSRAALQFFSWVGRQSYYMPTTETYNTAMKLAGSAKDFKYMRYLYREMRRVECSPTLETWNVMMCQYGNAGLTELALEAFYQMKNDGFTPERTTYNHLIMYLSHGKGRKVDAAIKIFQEMCCAGHTINNEIARLYIFALCDCGKTADARNSVVYLCKRGFGVQVGYSILLRSLSRAGRMEDALSLFDEVEEHGCSRDEYMYGSLIHGLLRSDRFEDAIAKLAEMKNSDIPQCTHMYTSFIVYFFQKRDVAKAVDVLKEMTQNGCELTIVTHSALIRGYMTMGMVSEAWDIFHRMRLKGPSPDYETYSMFMSCLCKRGRSEEGLQLIRDMLDSGIIPSAVNFRTVFHGLNREGKHELAHSVLQLKWHLSRQRTFSK